MFNCEHIYVLEFNVIILLLLDAGSEMQRNVSMPDQLNEVGLSVKSNSGSNSPRANSSSPRSSRYNLSDSNLLTTIKKKIHPKPDT